MNQKLWIPDVGAEFTILQLLLSLAAVVCLIKQSHFTLQIEMVMIKP
jgi:hypothetical protein